MNQHITELDILIVRTKAILAVICVLAIVGAMFFKSYSDPATLSALFLLTGSLIGNLRGSMQAITKPDVPPDSEATITQQTQTVIKTKPETSTDAPLVVTKQPEVAIKPEPSIHNLKT